MARALDGRFVFQERRVVASLITPLVFFVFLCLCFACCLPLFVVVVVVVVVVCLFKNG